MPLIGNDGFPPGTFLMYNFLIGILGSKWGDMQQEHNMHPTIQCFHVIGSGKHLTCWLADSLRTHTAVSLSPLHHHCEMDIGHPCKDKEWRFILECPIRVPHNARFHLIQYSVLHRASLTPQKINHYFMCTDATCPRSCLPMQI